MKKLFMIIFVLMFLCNTNLFTADLKDINNNDTKGISIKTYILGPADFTSGNGGLCQLMFFSGKKSDNYDSNGEPDLFALGGTIGISDNFVAPIHLPDGSTILDVSTNMFADSGKHSIIKYWIYRITENGNISGVGNLLFSTTKGPNVNGRLKLNDTTIGHKINNNLYTYILRVHISDIYKKVRLNRVEITYQ